MPGPRPDDIYNPVPTVSPEIGMPEDYLRTQGTPQAFGAQVGAAEQELGKTLGGAGQEAAQVSLQYQQMNNETVANETVQQYAKFASDREMQLRTKQGQNAITDLPVFQKDMQDTLTNMGNNIKSPAARLAFMTDARNFYDRSLYSAGLYVGDEARKGVLQSYQGKLKTINDFTTLHYHDPQAIAQGIQDTVNASLSIAHQEGIVDKDAVHALVSDNVSRLVDSAITMQMSQGVTLRDQLNSVKTANAMFSAYSKATIPGSPGVPMLNAQQADSLSQRLNGKEFQLQYRLDRQQDIAAAHQAVLLHSNLNNAIAMVEQGVVPRNIPSDAQIAAAYPRNPEAAEVMIERADSVRSMAEFTNVVPTATPDQLVKLRQEVYPDSNKPDYAGQVSRYRALNAVIDRRQQALSKDPAGYILQQHPDIAQSYQAADQNPALLGGYATDIHTTQTALGIPEYKQHLLPQGVAQGLANQIQANPQASLETMQSLQKKYGYLWPSVFHDVSTIGGLPVQYQSVANLPSQDATILSRVIQDKATTKDIEKTLPEVTRPGSTATENASTYIRKSISSPGSPIFAYTNSLTQSGSSPGQVAAFQDSVTSLAEGYVHYNGAKVEDAIKQAEKAFLGNTMYVGGARVPKDKFSTVTTNASATLHGINAGKIAWPKGVGEPGQPTMEEYLDTLKATPTWVTSPKDDALWLMDIGGRFVTDPTGHPITVPFNAPPIQPKAAPEQEPFGKMY